jgi:hypothetical protein
MHVCIPTLDWVLFLYLQDPTKGILVYILLVVEWCVYLSIQDTVFTLTKKTRNEVL